MVTTTVSSISLTGSPDYSVLQAWEDAAPANLVTADEIWRGEVDKVTDHFTSSSGVFLAFGGTTTDATRYKELTAKAGVSYLDHVAPRLGYDTSKGCSISNTGAGTLINMAEDHVHISRIQNDHANNGITMTGARVGIILDDVLVRGASTNFSDIAGTTAVLNNCIMESDASGASITVFIPGDSEYNNCTFIKPSDLTTNTKSINLPGSPIFNNCLFLDSTTTHTSGTPTFNNCLTLDTTPPTGCTTTTYAAVKFVGDTVATLDVQIEEGSSAIDAGTTIALNVDIFGTERPEGADYDVGVHEFVDPTNVITPSGGIVFGGTGDMRPATTTITPSGGIVFGGTGDMRPATTTIIPSDGGIIFGGTGGMRPATTTIIPSDGGFLFGGCAVISSNGNISTYRSLTGVGH